MLEVTADASGLAARAFAKQMDEQAATVQTRVEDALTTGSVRQLRKGGALKSGDRAAAAAPAVADGQPRRSPSTKAGTNAAAKGMLYVSSATRPRHVPCSESGVSRGSTWRCSTSQFTLT